MMIERSPDSDGEIGYETVNSSQSSMSSGSFERCCSFSRLSFDVTAASLPFFSSKPHRSSDQAWADIHSRGSNGLLGLKDFKVLRRIGSGDIGNVYLCRLLEYHNGDLLPSVYAMKVVDKQTLTKKKKLGRAETERRILGVLDHPFLPTLYADFDAPPHYSCVVMEYCAGGDLHSLRHRQPGGRFVLLSARFYAAEVLLALEYLHMLGIVYRDLKPENILIRSDGHIMLSDFDLSLESFSAPAVEFINPNPSTTSGEPDDIPSCIPDRLFRLRKPAGRSPQPNRQFVAEPVGARSNSFVGTHEYVAPEVASGESHGSAVDWWAYGIFLYEMLYGRTPFVGPSNEATLRNILKQKLSFPPAIAGEDDAFARNLISGLLRKNPSVRIGSRRGAADVKSHQFFKGLNLALLRSSPPPVIPGPGLTRSASCLDRQKPARFNYF